MRTMRWMGLALLGALCGAPALAQPGGPPDVVTRYDETDFPGNDIDDLAGRARSFDDCAQRCMADDRCGAFTYNLNDRNCIPKSSGASAQRNARAMSGVVNRNNYGGGRWSAAGGPPRGVTRYAATDFPGNDIGDMVGRTRSFDDCADRCVSDGRCNAFTYNLNDGNCIPKSGAAGAQRNERADSGTVNRAGGGPRPGVRPPRGEAVTRYDNTDFPGNDLGDMAGWARNYDECARRCLDDDRCAAFTYNLNNRICIPKSAALDRQRNDRADSGVVNRR